MRTVHLLLSLNHRFLNVLQRRNMKNRAPLILLNYSLVLSVLIDPDIVAQYFAFFNIGKR